MALSGRTVKKRLICACVALALLLLIGAYLLYSSAVKSTLERENECFYQVYDLVRDMDFATGRLEKDTLALYDGEGEPLAVIDVTAYPGKGSVKLRNDAQNRQIYFILGGAVDDEYGILYTAGSAVNMDGLYTLERLGGNSYYYSTN